MQSIPLFTNTLAVSSHNALPIIFAGFLLLILIAFFGCRHSVSRKLSALLDRIRQSMQQLDRDNALQTLEHTKQLLRKWDWLLNEHDQCGARQLIERVERIYPSPVQ